ncbi:hypothetical protein V7S43_005442 [Phytophthora oleae]|uniref:FYVE-type domain-containing protein n=1 Tax=Phytophthora oleae TaxID=2107226 RepID=A0ABD3FQR8_9STRA
MKDTTKMNLDDVVAYLQICDLPATLRFKKLSPVTDQPPVSVPRKSTYVITSGNNTGPTSPMGSQAPPAYPRGSQRGSTKYTPPPPAPSHPDRASMPVHNTQSDFPEPSAPPQRQSAKVPPTKKLTESPPKAAPKSVPKPAKPAPTPVEPVMFTDQSAYKQHPAVKEDYELTEPVTVKPTKAHKQKPASPRQSVAPEEKLRELDGLVLTSGVNDLGFEDSEDESVRASRESRDSWRDESFDVDADHGEWKIEEEKEEVEKKPSKERAKERFQRDKSGSTVAMLGHFSVETKGDGVPILPDAEEATGIALIDNVSDFSPEDHHASPSGHVRPSEESTGSIVSSLNSSMNNTMNTDAPRPSVRVTMDSTAPLMKSHPIGTLHEMCAKGNLRGVVQHLRVDGPEALLNREPNHGQTGLHLAVKSGKVPLVKVILEQYKPIEDLINVEDDKGNTALHFAATKTPAMVHLLLENGASANVKNSRKFTPLIISVITSKDDSVIIPRMLLKFGANPNDMHDSQTVIHTAISTGRLQIAGALVRAGAKMDVEDAEGKSVFEKLPRKDLRLLIAHVYFPPTYITRKERSECMLCHQKFKFGHREHNCTHCGRLCCAECSSLFVDMFKFPMGFPGRTRRGAANREKKRVCKTCYNVFKERNDEPEKSDMSKFINRVINIEWDEVNPEKLKKTEEAGRRGEKV